MKISFPSSLEVLDQPIEMVLVPLHLHVQTNNNFVN